MKLYSFFVYDSRNLSSMDVETDKPILHLVFGAGIVRSFAVLYLIDMNSHRWETDKRRSFSLFRAACSCRQRRPSYSVLSCVACMKSIPVVQTPRQPLRSAANVSSRSGGIAFFLSAAFRKILKRLNCPPTHLPKDANILAIYRNKADRADCGNIRGISLLSVGGNILARVMLNRLLTHAAEVILLETQCGFRLDGNLFKQRRLNAQSKTSVTHSY